jgi:hypothetical protein
MPQVPAESEKIIRKEGEERGHEWIVLVASGVVGNERFGIPKETMLRPADYNHPTIWKPSQ